MAVDPLISKAYLDEDLAGAREIAEEMGWRLSRLSDLVIRAEMTRTAIDRLPEEIYVFEFRFEDFKEMPPFIDAIHFQTGHKNVSSAYPHGHSYFHGNNVICAPWNRGAYQDHGGPHSDWPYSGWQQGSEGKISIGPMLHELHMAIYDPSYQGRRQ